MNWLVTMQALFFHIQFITTLSTQSVWYFCSPQGKFLLPNFHLEKTSSHSEETRSKEDLKESLKCFRDELQFIVLPPVILLTLACLEVFPWQVRLSVPRLRLCIWLLQSFHLLLMVGEFSFGIFFHRVRLKAVLVYLTHLA